LASLESEPSSEPEPDRDIFIKAPAFAAPVQQEETLADRLKRLIASPTEKIRLNDFISALLRNAAEQLSQDKFPLSGLVTNEEFASRIQRYEDAITDLVIAVVLLAQNAEPEQVTLLEKIFARAAEFDKGQAGVVSWIRLAWYPILVLMYATGISALAAHRFDALRTALLTPVYTPRPLLNQDMSPVVLPVIAELTDVAEDFKRLPDMQRKYVPRSEHLYKKLQPILEDQLFLERSYEPLFDQFEILLALSFADLRDDDVTRHVWGPPGRFFWKERGLDRAPVFTEFVNQAKARGDDWEPLKVGFFRRSAKRFSAVADAYSQRLGQVDLW
jgi:hypothetical protein